MWCGGKLSRGAKTLWKIDSQSDVRAPLLLFALVFALEHGLEPRLGAVNLAQRAGHFNVHDLVALAKKNRDGDERGAVGLAVLGAARSGHVERRTGKRTVGLVMAFLERLTLSALSRMVAPFKSKAAATFASPPNSTNANLRRGDVAKGKIRKVLLKEKKMVCKGTIHNEHNTWTARSGRPGRGQI